LSIGTSLATDAMVTMSYCCAAVDGGAGFQQPGDLGYVALRGGGVQPGIGRDLGGRRRSLSHGRKCKSEKGERQPFGHEKSPGTKVTGD
jgi:hypothetical protein